LIERFQKDQMKLKKPDGQAGKHGATIGALRKKCDGSFLPPLYGREQEGLWTTMNGETMLRLTELQFDTLSQASKDGFRYLFGRIVQDQEVYDLRWGAYMLATVKAETGVYRPIEESKSLWSKSTGSGEYAEEIAATDAAGKAYTGADAKPLKNRYYGRGYVQLTFLDNYRTFGEKLGLGDALVKNPELALEPDTAYTVASLGMREGLFASDTTGKAMSLPRFIEGSKCNYRHARQIINGLDRADEIAGYAIAFEVLMLLCTSGPPKGV
jgi:predicted chitinase